MSDHRSPREIAEHLRQAAKWHGISAAASDLMIEAAEALLRHEHQESILLPAGTDVRVMLDGMWHDGVIDETDENDLNLPYLVIFRGKMARWVSGDKLEMIA